MRAHSCMHVNMCTGVRTVSHRHVISYILWIHYFEHSHRSSQSSIFLSGCAALRLHWGRWGQPCPPLYWSAGGSSAAPPPWTEWSAAGCPSAQPPPHHHAPPEYWPTGGRRREKGLTKRERRWRKREFLFSAIENTLKLLETGETPQ